MMRKLAGETVAYTFFGGARSVISLIFLMIYLHQLAKEQFGAIDIMVTVLSMFTVLVLQFNEGYSRYFYDDRDDLGNYSSSMLWFHVAAGIVVGLLAIPAYFAAHLLLPGVEDASRSLALTFLSFLPAAIHEFALVNFRMLHNMKLYGVLSIGESLVKGALGVVFIMSMHMGIFGYALSISLGSAVTAVVAMPFVSRLMRGGRFDGNVVRRIVRFSFPTLPGAMLNYLNRYGGRFIILSYVGLHELAVYSLSMRIGNVAKMIIQSFRKAWLPFAMEKIGHKDKAQTYSAIFSVFTGLSFALLICSTLGAVIVVRYFAPAGYSLAAALVPFIIASTIISAAGTILNIGNLVAEKTGWISLASGVACAVNLGLSLLLARHWGITGVVVGSLGGSMAMMLILYAAAQRNDETRFPPLSLLGMFFGMPGLSLLLYIFFRAWEVGQ